MCRRGPFFGHLKSEACGSAAALGRRQQRDGKVQAVTDTYRNVECR